ncbi:MAG: hypothetical protein LUF90_00115 [Rikenellaceae bacterium]|nr:hypothetical protein [Rikenellaceae bacterium]
MKQLFYYLLVAAIALTSCSKEEEAILNNESEQTASLLRDTDHRLTVDLSLTNNTGKY